MSHGAQLVDPDAVRVASIERYDVLRGPRRMDLESIAELAALVCSTPMATVNLLTEDAQFQVATHGFDPAVCAREDSMCARTLDDTGPVIVPDARLDPRFRDNPFVNGVIGSVRFYASRHLVTPEGVVIGTLCVFDEEPRELDSRQVHALGTLADRVVDVLELSLRSRQLATSNERLSEFAGRVSHDLKAPLATVVLALETVTDLLEGDETSAPVRRILERAVGGTQRMATMIDEVLAFSEKGALTTWEPVDLESVLDDVVADLDAVYRDATIERLPLPTVSGDRVLLRSVLQNFLDNAAKYRSPDRPLHVVVSADRHPADVDEVEEMWRISVADNGPGVPAEARDRVFARGERLVDDDRGSGFGLDTCRRAVQAHGGRVGVGETPGGGATFWFEVPASTAT